LTDFHSGTVNLIQEEENTLLTSSDKPVRGIPSGSLAAVDSRVGSVRKTKKVTFGHLGSPSLDNREAPLLCNLVDDL
jgi:hypothetical protein